MTSNDPERQSATARRRQFLFASATVGTAALAGCTADSTDPSDDTTDSSDDSTDPSDDQHADGEPDDDPNFRLLISDMPADIGDFDRLDVSFDSARIFEGDNADEEDDTEGGDETDETEDGDAGENDAADDSDETENDDSDDESGDSDETAGSDRGFYVVDLDGATVDLTQVVGERAMPVFEGTLSPGTYQKVELHVATIEGIVDGETAEVKVPSEKLQITKPFEVRADETVDFVFDINVVRRGQGNRYNLTPVISESGVAGEDVEVEEVDDESEDEDDTDESEDDEGDGPGDDTDESEDSGEGDGSGDGEDDTGDDAGGDDEPDGSGDGTGE